MSDEARAAVADLAGDLAAWLEWAQATGAVGVPAAAVQSPSTAGRPARRTAQAQPPQPRPPRQQAVVQQVAASVTQEAALGDADGLLKIRAELGDCQRCRLSRERRQIVFGVGSQQARLVLVGEAPGHYEDVTGEPFVGRSGQLLTRMLAAIGLARTEVYICNVIKCRPPKNRDPQPDEVAACSPFLHKQVASIRPTVIMTLGRFAARCVVGIDAPLSKMRGQLGSFQQIPVVSSYHPAYLLRTPKMKAAAWEDLRRVRKLLSDGR